MKFEFKKDIVWKPGIPPEKMAELMREFDKKFSGLEQRAKGLVKRNAAEGFLQLFPAETRRQIEDEVARLRELKDFTRFRTDTVLTFAEMLIIGLKVSGNEDFLGKLTAWAEEWNVKK